MEGPKENEYRASLKGVCRSRIFILSKFYYSIETWHPCTFITKINPSMELAKNQDLGPPGLS